MNRLFIPYAGRRPATVSVNGHELVIVSRNRNQLKNGLKRLGATRIRTVDDAQDPELVVESLAQQAKARIVLPPPDVSVQDVIAGLETSLPWIQ